MMQITAVAALFSDLPVIELTGWVERGWVRPEPVGSGWVFHDIDVARVHLIYDLRRDMDVAEETMPLVLSLLDQMYEMRGRLRAVLQAVEAQPADVRQAIQQRLSR